MLPLMNAIRLTWMGLHAIMGWYMDSPALIRFREHPGCSTDVLLQHNVSVATSISPAPLSQEEQAFEPLANLIADVSSFPDGTSMLKIVQSLISMLPKPQSETLDCQPFDGWYLVSNWCDDHVCLNDSRKPNFRGATTLEEIPNGTLLYIMEIFDYKGLHNSPDQWGYTVYNGHEGYVPMNLLQRLLY